MYVCTKIPVLKIKKEIKIAVVFIVTLALLYWGINFLKGRDLFNKERIYYAVYNQVNGLVVANPVLVNGFRVGHVKKMYFHPDNSGRIIVEFILNNSDLDIPVNSVARLFSSDLLGSRAVEIQLGNSTTMAKDGDTLKTFVQATLGEEVNVQFQPIKQKFESVMLSIDTVLVIMKSIFNENTQKNLEQSFESIRATIQNLEHTTYNIDTLVVDQKYKLASIIGNVESITLNIKKNNDKISNIITNFSSISDTLAKAKIASTVENANKSLKSFADIMDKINRGEGSLGMLIKNDSLYNNLNGASKQLNELIEDVKLNPGRYVNISVFGGNKKKNAYKPPKK
jgi:phospholipid/cholesterol/gamma-HCH transport system substrate-binding protein